MPPGRVFELLDAFYPIPQSKTLRPVPWMPYLSYAPSAWVLPLKFTGGGLSAPGKIMFDAEGNAWTGVNFIVGSQASDDLWDGNLSEFAPNGDVWALDFENDQVVYLPKGDPGKVKFFCRATDSRPNKDSPCKLNAPFHLAIDQQDRIWITNALGDTVTRFPATDPSKEEVFPTGGHSGKGMAIDSQGNAWITNTMGAGLDLAVKLRLLAMKGTGRMSEFHRVVFDYLNSNPSLGSITMLRPDGSPAPGSPFHGGGSWGSWAVVIDGNDQVWSSNFAGASITELCGARTNTCPPGMKTGDPISLPGRYVGGGMQPLTDIAIDPAGNVWVADN